jgi:hypothetical protein
MLRLFGLGLAAALTLCVGPAEAQPSKQQYISAVRSLELGHVFDEVVNYDRVPCPVPHFGCRPDTSTAVGDDWLRWEGRLRTRIHAFASVQPPRGIAELHYAWLRSLRDCGARMQRLEPTVPQVDNLDVIDEFEKDVGEQAWLCVRGFGELVPKLKAKGYEFNFGNLSTVVGWLEPGHWPCC